MFPLLGETALVHHQRRAAPTKMGIGIGDQLPQDASPIPGGFAQHVVQPLVVASGNHIGHALHIGAGGLIQPAQVVLGRLGHRTGRGFKEGRVGKKVVVQLGQDGTHQSANAFDILELECSFTTP